MKQNKLRLKEIQFSNYNENGQFFFSGEGEEFENTEKKRKLKYVRKTSSTNEGDNSGILSLSHRTMLIYLHFFLSDYYNANFNGNYEHLLWVLDCVYVCM